MPDNQITIIDVYHAITETKQRVDELHTSVLGRGGVFDRVDDLEKNNEKQKEFMWKFAGGVVVLAFLIPIAVKFFTN